MQLSSNNNTPDSWWIIFLFLQQIGIVPSFQSFGNLGNEVGVFLHLLSMILCCFLKVVSETKLLLSTHFILSPLVHFDFE
jgi:hypothetical protein